jgi:hypothetical protein
METRSVVFERQPARFNMAGQFICYPLKQTDEDVSHGLVKRLASYAEKRLRGIGLFPQNVRVCEVSTMDAENSPADREYAVEFFTAEGGSIVMEGILTKSGWPTLDHGFSVNE